MILTSLIFTALLFLGAGTGFGSMNSVEGTIQGANCVVLKSTCPIDTNDPHIALESDFVLLTDDGKYYFLPNITRSLKTSFLHKKVRASGDIKGLSIMVADLSVQKGSGYESVWNWAEIVKRLTIGK